MKFCPIIPVNAFEAFKQASDHWMALVQFLHIKKYREFFQEKLQKGETVILDNGAYEGATTSFKDLAFWAKELKPSVLVLPDSIGNFARTFTRTRNYLDEYGLPSGTEGMTVLQGQNGELEQFVVAYQLCPTKWVGFTKNTHQYGITMQRPCARWMFAEWLKAQQKWRPELKHHALGMLGGNAKELEYLSAVGFHSCDSSVPVWRGLLGYSLEDMRWPGYEYIPLPGDEASNFEQAKINLSEVMEACGEHISW